MFNWLISLFKPTSSTTKGEPGPIGPAGLNGKDGKDGEKGPKGDKGDNGESKKINVPLEEINNPALQTKDDYFIVFKDKLTPFMDVGYMLGGYVEHSFFKETSTTDEDVSYLRLVIVSPENEIVKHLPSNEIKEMIWEKRLVPGAQYWSLNLRMNKVTMEKHLAGSENKIIMMFVGDKREFITNEMDAVDYLLMRINKLENQFQRLDRH
jgi:hypothetical protein